VTFTTTYGGEETWPTARLPFEHLPRCPLCCLGTLVHAAPAAYNSAHPLCVTPGTTLAPSPHPTGLRDRSGRHYTWAAAARPSLPVAVRHHIAVAALWAALTRDAYRALPRACRAGGILSFPQHLGGIALRCGPILHYAILRAAAAGLPPAGNKTGWAVAWRYATASHLPACTRMPPARYSTPAHTPFTNPTMPFLLLPRLCSLLSIWRPGLPSCRHACLDPWLATCLHIPLPTCPPRTAPYWRPSMPACLHCCYVIAYQTAFRTRHDISVRPYSGPARHHRATALAIRHRLGVHSASTYLSRSRPLPPALVPPHTVLTYRILHTAAMTRACSACAGDHPIASCLVCAYRDNPDVPCQRLSRGSVKPLPPYVHSTSQVVRAAAADVCFTTIPASRL